MAMAAIDFRIRRGLDKDVLAGLVEIAKSMVGTNFECQHFRYRPFYQDQTVTIPFAEIGTHQPLQSLLAENGAFILDFHLVKNFQENHFQGWTVKVLRKPKDEFLLDSVSVEAAQNNHSPADEASYRKLAFATKKGFEAIEPNVLIREQLSTDSRRNYELELQTLDFLKQRIAELQDVTSKYTVEQDARLREKADRLERDIMEKREQAELAATQMRTSAEEEVQLKRAQLDAELNEKRTRVEADLEERVRKLNDETAARRQELDARQEHIDSLENQASRRALRMSLKRELAARKTSFELTPKTQKLRRWTFASVSILALLFLAGVIYSGWQMAEVLIPGGKPVAAGEVDWVVVSWLSIRQLIFTAGFTGVAIFLVKWTNKWAEQHASEEFRLKRLDLDIDRASWVVETALDWKEQKDSDIPPELLEAISRHLFTDTPVEREAEIDLHGIGALGKATNLSIKLPSGSSIGWGGGKDK